MFSLDGYRALREQAGVVRRGDRGLLRVAGPDRLTWLQGLLTNDVVALPIGGVCEAAYLTPQGRMITDVRVFNLADRTLLDVPAPLAEGLQAKLDSLLFSEDAQVEDVSRSVVCIEVHGPAAPVVVERAQAELSPATLAIVRHDGFDLPGFSLFAAATNADLVVDSCRRAGAIETTLATLDVIRIEAGRPAFLIDMDEHTIPLEAGIENRAVSFTKGCYVGQEVIVRVVHRGQGRVAKKLVGLRLESSDVPQAGNLLRAGDREVGRVTSAAWSPALQRSIALGYVHRDFTAAGTPLDVISDTGQFSATVSPLPFVDAAATALQAHP